MNATFTYLSFFWWNPIHLFYIFYLHIFYTKAERNQKMVEDIEIWLETIRYVNGPRSKGSFGSGKYLRYKERPDFLRAFVPDSCNEYHQKGCTKCFNTCLPEQWWVDHKGKYNYHSDKQIAKMYR